MKAVQGLACGFRHCRKKNLENSADEQLYFLQKRASSVLELLISLEIIVAIGFRQAFSRTNFGAKPDVVSVSLGGWPAPATPFWGRGFAPAKCRPASASSMTGRIISDSPTGAGNPNLEFPINATAGTVCFSGDAAGTGMATETSSRIKVKIRFAFRKPAVLDLMFNRKSRLLVIMTQVMTGINESTITLR